MFKNRGAQLGPRSSEYHYALMQVELAPYTHTLLVWVDAVDKVGDEQRTGNNRIQVPSFLNLYCAPDSYLESMLLTRPSKNVYRQHRSEPDIPHAN